MINKTSLRPREALQHTAHCGEKVFSIERRGVTFCASGPQVAAVHVERDHGATCSMEHGIAFALIEVARGSAVPGKLLVDDPIDGDILCGCRNRAGRQRCNGNFRFIEGAGISGRWIDDGYARGLVVLSNYFVCVLHDPG